MNGNEATDAFYELLAREMAPRLDERDTDVRSHWILIRDGRGVEACRLHEETGEIAVQAVLARHLAGGAEAAAYMRVDAASISAEVLIAEPRNSDLRRAAITPGPEGLSIGPWTPEL